MRGRAHSAGYQSSARPGMGTWGPPCAPPTASPWPGGSSPASPVAAFLFLLLLRREVSRGTAGPVLGPAGEEKGDRVGQGGEGVVRAEVTGGGAAPIPPPFPARGER